MWFEEEDILEIPLLEPMDNLPIAFLAPKEEVALIGEPKKAEMTAACPSKNEEWAPEPKDAVKLMDTAAESQGMQVHL